MSNAILTSKTALATPASGDILYIIDISDTTDNAAGSSRKITYANLTGGILSELGITSSVAEINFVDGVTSAVQTQLNAKAPLASPTFTGTVTLPVGLTGVIRTDTGVVSVDSDVTDLVSAASTTAAGKIEIAIASEVNTGTDATRAVSPDALAGSNLGVRIIEIPVFGTASDTTTGDGKVFFRMPSYLNGMNLVSIAASVYTAGTTGNLDIMVRNITDSQDMLSTAARIETGEVDTSTSAQPGTINTALDDVATADRIAIDIDAVQTGTAAKGLVVELGFQTP